MKHSYLPLGLAFIMVFGMTVTPSRAASPAPFSDIAVDSPLLPAVTYAKDTDLIRGYADGTFRPDNTVNRAELLKIVVQHIQPNGVTGGNCFPDVTNQWFAPYVCTAHDLGIVSGYDDGNFHPEYPVTFAESAKILTLATDMPLPNSGVAWFTQFAQALASAEAVPVTIAELSSNLRRGELVDILYRLSTTTDTSSSLSYATLLNASNMLSALPEIASCSELNDRFAALAHSGYHTQTLYQQNNGIPPIATPQQAPLSAGVGSAASTVTTADTDHSTDNVHILLGEDQGDIIKNDGRYLYIVRSDKTVRIVRSYPAETMEEVAIIRQFSTDTNLDIVPQEIYMRGGMLAVIGVSLTGYSSYQTNTTSSPLTDTSTTSTALPVTTNSILTPSKTTTVSLFDIQNRAQPKLTRTVTLEGEYRTSRLIGNNLYFMSVTDPWYGAFNQSGGAQSTLPLITDSTTGLHASAADCSAIGYFPGYIQPSFLTVAGLDMSLPTQEVTRAVYFGQMDNLLASQTHLYVATTVEDPTTYFPYQDSYTSVAPAVEQTRVYQFALANARSTFTAQGVVDGTVLNQFSMEEYNDTFRIATTQNTWKKTNTTDSKNQIVILDAHLNQLGSITDIAPDQIIYSARFIGNRGYLVTFNRNDPLFVFDLTDATHPKKLGQMSLPGYSDYLQPVDATHVIGFGNSIEPSLDVHSAQQASPAPNTEGQGFKMALFDVSNPALPELMFTRTIGKSGTQSSVLTNHTALLFDKEKSLLAFPITITGTPALRTDCNSSTTSSTCPPGCIPPQGSAAQTVIACVADTTPVPLFQGAVVYHFDLTTGFTERGTMTQFPANTTSGQIGDGFTESIKRVLYIGNRLYGVSYAGLSAETLDTVQPISTITFAQ